VTERVEDIRDWVGTCFGMLLLPVYNATGPVTSIKFSYLSCRYLITLMGYGWWLKIYE
jgi:hypothetical protein